MFHGSMRHYANGKKKKYNAWTSSKKPKPAFKPLTAKPSAPIRGDVSHIPSAEITSHCCEKIDPPKYTGSLVKGISTMHKSNAVPIIDEKEAKEHASMRR